MAYVIVGIGSNLGNRQLNVARAISRLMREFGTLQVAHSVKSAPLGFDSENTFLNTAAIFSDSREPEEILSIIQKIERDISPTPHRKADGSYADREIDIDIIAIDSLVYSSPRLQIPHPQMHLRRFVLEPMAEIAGGWRHPASGKSVIEMLYEHRLKEQESDDKRGSGEEIIEKSAKNCEKISSIPNY